MLQLQLESSSLGYLWLGSAERLLAGTIVTRPAFLEKFDTASTWVDS